MLAKDIMTKDVITVSPAMDLKEVAEIFIRHNISGAPVVDSQKRLVGVITEGDLVKQQRPLQKPLYLMFLDSAFPINQREIKEEIKVITAGKVEELMSSEPITLPEYADVSELAQVMLSKKINRLPIVNEEDELLGIVTRQDIIRATYLGEDND
ncbi:CBS domain-containing protein [Peptococcus simiae]|uniref:CBS domain-containing protein n=1 Tax=Peptococcus simiae TaxID=1643805 RepID=A0ABW9GZA9_9FIRM